MTTPARAPSRRPSPRPARPASRTAARQSERTLQRTTARTADRTTSRARSNPRPPARAVGAAAPAAALRRDERTRPAKARPNLEVVAVERDRKLRLRLLGGLAGLLLFGSLLGLAVFHSVLVQGQLGLDRTEQQIEAEQDLQRSLRKQVAELASPERIQAEAAARGMVLPDERAYLQAVVPGQVVPPPGADQ